MALIDQSSKAIGPWIVRDDQESAEDAARDSLVSKGLIVERLEITSFASGFKARAFGHFPKDDSGSA